jgi:hypothetical protein
MSTPLSNQHPSGGFGTCIPDDPLTPDTVVDDGNVLEDLLLQYLSRREAIAVNRLGLERIKEALGAGVVEGAFPLSLARGSPST